MQNDDGDQDNNNIIPLSPRREQAARQEKSDRVRVKVTLGQPGNGYAGERRAHAEPMINLPPFTKILLASILLIHAVGSFALTPVQHYWIMDHFGFVPAYYSEAMPWTPYAFFGPVTFAFIHGGWFHVLINAAMLMAFGAGLERWMGWKRMALFMLGCSLASAAVQFAVNINSTNPVIGASGAISGMFAAIVIMMQQQRGSPFAGRYGLMPFIAIWIIIAVVFGMMGGPGGESIAWPAHIGGFLAGLALIKPVMRLKV